MIIEMLYRFKGTARIVQRFYMGCKPRCWIVQGWCRLIMGHVLAVSKITAFFVSAG